VVQTGRIPDRLDREDSRMNTHVITDSILRLYEVQSSAVNSHQGRYRPAIRTFIGRQSIVDTGPAK
jgi:hypothetical protein